MMHSEEGSPHLVRRDNIFSDVLKIYENFSRIANEFPFRVAFDDENALDTGGVTRDMLSGFWISAFDKFFDGAGSLVPAAHPNIDMNMLPVIGTILSHGYIVSGFLPVRMSFPVLAAILLSPTVEIDDSLLCECFIDHLSYYDASILKEAFLEKSSFSPDLHSRVLALLACFNSRKIASPANLKSIVTNIARHEFLIKPLGAIYQIHAGIPVQHRSFWVDMKLKSLQQVYLHATATTSSVLEVIKEPHFMDAAQSMVYGYLQQYIKNLRTKELGYFLRFITGSSALVVDEIKITFNGLSGLSRRPIAHTCSSTLELSTAYETFMDFNKELDNVLSSEFAWIMDAI